MRSNPSFPIKITGYTDRNSESNVQASWSRVYEVRKYLVDQLGLDENRIYMNPNILGQPYLVQLEGLNNEDRLLQPGVIPPYFPGFIDEKNMRILNW